MALITMKVTGYYTAEVPDDVNDEIMHKGNEITQEEDFGALRDIEWHVSSIQHDDGEFDEFE